MITNASGRALGEAARSRRWGGAKREFLQDHAQERGREREMGRLGTIVGGIAGVAAAAVAVTVIASALPADRPATTSQSGGQVAYGAITQLGSGPSVATAAQ